MPPDPTLERTAGQRRWRVFSSVRSSAAAQRERCWAGMTGYPALLEEKNGQQE